VVFQSTSRCERHVCPRLVVSGMAFDTPGTVLEDHFWSAVTMVENTWIRKHLESTSRTSNSWNSVKNSVMCVSRQKPRLEAENLLPWPRLDVLMPRLVIIASVLSLLPRSCLASPCGYCLGLISSASPRLDVETLSFRFQNL